MELSLASLIEIPHSCMLVAQLFEVTVAADGSKLSSKRVSKLSRRYHRHKKQLRQSAMMAEVSSDACVCAKCLYENQYYQRCMGPECDELRPGSMLDTSDFALSHQPPFSGRLGCLFLFSGIGFFYPKKPFLPGFLRISFFPVFFSGGISSRELGFGGVLKIPVFSRFHRIFLQEFLRDRNSCICTGFLRIPPDSSGFLFPL